MELLNILANTYESFAIEPKESLENLPIFYGFRMKYLILWGILVP